MVEKQKII